MMNSNNTLVYCCECVCFVLFYCLVLWMYFFCVMFEVYWHVAYAEATDAETRSVEWMQRYGYVGICLNERMLRRTVFTNKKSWRCNEHVGIRTIGTCSSRKFMTCRAFPLRLERQSSSFLWLVSFNYQFSSVSRDTVLVSLVVSYVRSQTWH